MSNFWDNMWLIVSTFVFIAYLLVLFHVVTDLFRDSSIGGGAKILWLIFLIFLPMMTVLAYILFRGDGMAQRQKAAMASAKSDTDAYIRFYETFILEATVGNVAAFVLEPAQGWAGSIFPPEDFFPKLKKLCEKYKILLYLPRGKSSLSLFEKRT